MKNFINKLQKNIPLIIIPIMLVYLQGCTSNEPTRPLNDILLKENHVFSNITFIEPSSKNSDDEIKLLQKYFPLTQSYIENFVPYNASDDKSRFENLKSAIFGDKKYIWASRGGYGSARLFTDLQFIKKPKTSKVLIGYSDITFLHLLFNKWGWKSIHGAMPVDLLKEDKNTENFTRIWKVMAEPRGVMSYNNIKSLNLRANAIHLTEGELIGGNLTLLANSLGTPWQLNGENKIIFIEDVGAKGYVIDRDLNHLKQAGVFDKATAVLFGHFMGGDEHKQYAIQRFADSLQIPVFYADYFGHGNDNFPLPFGFTSKIYPDEGGTNFRLTINYDFR